MAEIQRDPRSGKIISSQLAPEEAKQLAEIAHENRISGRRLLEEAGYPDFKSAPEHLRLLANIASSHRAGNIAALNAFLKLTGQSPDSVTNGMRRPLNNEFCPLCGTLVQLIPAEDALRMLHAMGELGVENVENSQEA